MRTVFTALASFSGCTAARWDLERSRPLRGDFLNGRVRLKSLWNDGAAFSLPFPKGLLAPASAAALGMLWVRRRRSPLAVGLILGGGLSNLWERTRNGRVYDYVQFPKAPGPLRRYVFNLADFSILAGGVLLLVCHEKN